MKIGQKQIISLFLIIFFLVVGLLHLANDIYNYTTIENIKLSKTVFISYYEKNPNLFLFIYFVTYVICASFSLPGATFLTLAGGAIFGIYLGTIAVSFASTFGATIAMLISRYLIKDWVQKRFKKEMKNMDHYFSKDGIYYLFSLRLIPLIPFFIVNLVMGVTSIRIKTFFGLVN